MDFLRQRIAQRPHSGGKQLHEVPAHKFQALRSNVPATLAPLDVWRRDNGRADIANRIKELDLPVGLEVRCSRTFWATEAA